MSMKTLFRLHVLAIWLCGLHVATAQPRAVADFIKAVDGDSAKVYAMTVASPYYNARYAIFANSSDSIEVWFQESGKFGALYGHRLGWLYVGAMSEYAGRASIRTFHRSTPEYRMMLEAMLDMRDRMRPDSLPGRGQVGNYSFGWTP